MAQIVLLCCFMAGVVGLDATSFLQSAGGRQGEDLPGPFKIARTTGKVIKLVNAAKMVNAMEFHPFQAAATAAEVGETVFNVGGKSLTKSAEVMDHLVNGNDVASSQTFQTGPCACLNWEVAFPEIKETIPIFERRFMSMLSGFFCIKTSPGADSKQYCYVNSTCAEGESQASGTFKKRFCDGEVSEEGFSYDFVLGNMKFEDYVPYAKQMKLELNAMTPHVYPTFEGANLSDVLSFWGLDPGEDLLNSWGMDKGAPLSDELRQRLEAVRDSGKTTLFASPSGKQTGVAEGKKFFWISLGKKASFYGLMGKLGFEFMWNHRDELSDAKCVAGCEEVFPLW